MSIPGQEDRLAFNALTESWKAHLNDVQEARHDQERGCGDDAPEQTGVRANHGVLQRIRQHQQQHKVNGAKLRRLAATKEAQADEQEEVDRHGA